MTSELAGLGPRASSRDYPKAIERIATLETELASYRERLAAAETAASREVAALSDALSAIEENAVWRATAPLRAAVARLPEAVQRALSRLARRTYWTLTPHRMPSRRRWFVDDPSGRQTSKRLTHMSTEVRARLGMPLRRSYGPSAFEQLDIYPGAHRDAPIFVFIHGGGGWRAEPARDSGFPAEMFVNAGAHFVVLDFIGIKEAEGDLQLMAEQVQRGVAWVYRNAASFGGDPDRLFVGGHSSGGHLCGVVLVTQWQKDFGLPADIIKGGLLMSGLFELKPIRASRPKPLIRFTDEIEEAMSPQRHIAQLRAPVVITYGTNDPPEFRRQSCDFFAALAAAGKPARLIEAAHFGHMEMAESLGNSYAPNGRAALELMQLSGVSAPHPAGSRQRPNAETAT